MNKSIQRLLPSFTDVLSAGGLAMAGAVMTDQKIGDPTTNAVVLSAAQPFLVRLIEWLCDQKTTDEFRNERDREFLDEVQRQLVDLVQLAESAKLEAQRTSQQAITVQEAIVLIDQYRDHAARSVLDERRKLLAAAAAATFRPDIDVEMKARAERALAILEPSDIVVLRKWVKQIESVKSNSEAISLFNGYPLTNRMALEQSGCVILQSKLDVDDQAPRWDLAPPSPRLRHIAIVTPLGAAVLLLLETYRDPSHSAARR